MARSLSLTLIQTSKAAASSSSSSSSYSYLVRSPKFRSMTSFRSVFRGHYSTLSDSHSHSQPPDVADAEAVVARKIEDAIHRLIVKRSTPDWLPFVPGASYWVPPKRRNYGIAQIVNKLANSLSDDEVMSLTTSRGWPSTAFYIQSDASSDRTEAVETSNCESHSEDEEG